MKGRKSVFFGGVVLLLVFVSLFIYSQIVAQDDDQFTQAEFIRFLLEVLGINVLPTWSLADMITVLAVNTGVPVDTWSDPANTELTKEVAAEVFADILDIEEGDPEYSQLNDLLDTLGDEDADLPSLEDLTTFVNDLSQSDLNDDEADNPYLTPISPTQ